MTLHKLRKKWEDGDPVLIIGTDHITEGFGFMLVVVKNCYQENAYSCHRYFTIAGEWNVSMDLYEVEPDLVFSWLQQHEKSFRR